MKPSKKTIILSTLVGLATVVAVFLFIRGEVAKRDVTTYADVVVAKVDIEPRTMITGDMIALEKVREDNIISNAITSETLVIGKYSSVKMVQNEQVASHKIADLSNTNFSYKIPKGFIAVTISVDQVTGVADAINPGDYVDVLVFQKEKEASALTRNKNFPESARDMLQRVLVLSVDKEADAGQAETDKEETDRKITLSLVRKDAEKLVLALRTGYIHLGLRNPDDDSKGDTSGTIRNDITPR